LETYRTRFGEFGRGVYRLPDAYRRIQDAQKIEIGGRIWDVVVGRGHAPEHVCLWCRSEDLFISGDQILPRISSNISLFPTEPEANPLQDWLDSCAQLEALLSEDVLVLPAHNEPFRGAPVRQRELISMHETNMDKLLALLSEPKRAVDCFPALFRSRITSGNYLMAAGESLAHLNCLRARGAIVRTTDANGVDWYRAS
jgi:glyoxylase-like metal-dependent hydrolase (beta-lactamase superfamily II)